MDWGNDYTLKKPCWVFRQLSTPLEVGMRVVESVSSNDAVKVTSFLSAKRTLVVHVANNSEAATPVQLTIAGTTIAGTTIAPPTRQRTSATEDAATLAPLAASPTGYADTLPARSLTTYQIQMK